MAAFVSESDFLQITDVIIKHIEGGYFHPLMFNDGRLKYNSVFSTSGETMFGLDRVNGAQLALRSKKWGEFWSLIDKQNASKLWVYNYKGGSLEGQLRTLVGQIMYPWFLYLANKYLSAETKLIVANSKGLKMHFVYACWNGEGWFRRFSYIINDKVHAGERDANKLFQLAIASRTGSSYSVIQKSGRKIAALAGGFEDIPPSTEVYTFEYIGQVEIPTSVYSVNTEADVAVFTAWEDPKELAMSQEASQLATQAIEAAYPAEESVEILQNLGPILNAPPAPVFNVKLPFLIIKAFDYFGQKFTVLPQISSFLKNAFSTKSKVIQFIAVNVLAPQLQRAVAMSPSTTAPLESILGQLRSIGVSDPALLSISDVSLLVERIRETGLVVFDTVNPLAEITELLEEEKNSIENPEIADTEIYSCPDGEVTLAPFRGNEVELVAEQCCEPVEIEEEEIEIPEIAEPELLTEEQILEFVAGIDQVAENMASCGNRKGEALLAISRVEKIKEDLYPLTFFAQKRFEFLEAFEKGTISTAIPFSTTDLTALTSTAAFSVNTFLKKSILNPSDKDTSSQYTNQSGVIPGEPDKFFLIISEEGSFVKEISTIFKMISDTGSFSKFVFASESLPKDLKKTSKTSKGTLYREFYDKFNSADRVNFLFTEEEQGFLTPRPSPAQILTPEGEQMIRDLRIDEVKAAEFLRTYSSEESIRAQQKLEALKKSEYFTELEKYAKEEASTLYSLLKIFTSPALLFKAVTVKKEKDKMIEEHRILQAFLSELEKKIRKQREIIAECDECLREQQASIERFSQPESTIPVPPPGSDPFGFMPPNPFMPGVSKNRYWKEYTKSLQTVSFMPIPDVQNLKKRLFRYYPVGLQIPVPVPPTTLPTLASGIPDKKISIPFPILWKHITSLSTPAGQFVLWITYCAPFTIAPYLMFIDENLNVVFLSSAKGKVEVPAKSLKWNDDSSLAKSLIERIPGLKIPTKSLPPVDNRVNNKTPDDKKGAIQEIRSRIKSKIDSIDNDSQAFSEKRIQKRTKLRQYREKLSKTLDTRNGYIDIDVVEQMLEEIKEMIKDQASKMLDFEPFEAPKTTKKRAGSETLTELQNLFSKAKSLKKSGAMLEMKTVNIEKIFTQKALSVLDTKFGKKISEDLERDLAKVDRELQEKGEKRRAAFEKARARVLAEKAKEVLMRVASKVDSKAMGFVEVPISLIPHFLPEPARAAIAIEPMPPWMPIVTQAVKKAADIVLDEIVNFEESIMQKMDLRGRLPRGRDLMAQTVISAVNVVLDSPQIKSFVPFPGWPREISYPSVNMLKQSAKDAVNAIWKIKLRPPGGGMPGIKVSPEMVSGFAMPVLDAALDLVFARMLQEFSRLPFEQNDSASIKLQRTLQFTKNILGNDVWDINEQDIKRIASQFVRDSLVQVDTVMGKTLETIDTTKKTFNSILKKLAPFSKQNTEKKEEPSLDIGGAVATAFFKTITAKFVSGELPSPPYPVVLLGCATGLPGWTIFTKTDPFRAIEKLPPYERISLKSVPFVIFLDMIAATAQRYGGIGSNYVAPYFVPDA